MRNSKDNDTKTSFNKSSRKGNFKGNQRNRKGSSRTNNRRDRDGDICVSSGSTSSLNDISWYSRNPELLAAAARLPFPYKPGMVLPAVSLNHVDGVIDIHDNVKYTVPGVMGLHFYYSVGYSEDVTSPASIAAREMYARVRSKFSGSLDADAPDIFMYCMALDSIHAYIAYLKRVYKILNLYSPYNRDYPDNILYAMGCDAEEASALRARKVEFWGKINTLVNMVNKFTVPNDMDLYNRHRWMNENVYLDGPDPGSQSYIFIPRGFFKVDTMHEQGTSLSHVSAPSNFDLDNLYNYGLTMIDALSNWDDAYTINGYLMRAFEGTTFYTATLLDENDVMVPVFVPEVLSQIENFTGVGDIPNANLFVTQEPTTNAILHRPHATLESENFYSYWQDNVLNMHTAGTPDGAQVTIASRLMASFEMKEGGRVDVHAGTEVPSYVSLTMQWTPGMSDTFRVPQIQVISTSEPSYGVTTSVLTAQFLKTAFDWAPRTWMTIYKDEDNQSGNFLTSLLNCDVDNVTVMPDSILKELHRVCIYSEFNCFR